MFEKDPQTEAIVMIGEIGGSLKKKRLRTSKSTSPSQLWVTRWCDCAERQTYGSRRCHHCRGKGTADEKFAALEAAGVKTFAAWRISVKH